MLERLYDFSHHNLDKGMGRSHHTLHKDYLLDQLQHNCNNTQLTDTMTVYSTQDILQLLSMY